MVKKIWQKEITPESLNRRNKGSLADFLGVVFTQVGDDYLQATMQVMPHHLQPHGIMHGGVSCMIAETVGSVAGNYCIADQHYCVGVDINTNHISAVRSGELLAVGTPYHLGRLTQVWSITIQQQEKLVSVSRLTLIIRNL